jgi:hypothetical protein
MAEKKNYPMVSEKNWWALRDKFKSSFPQSVSPVYIKTLLLLASDASANSNVITPLKNLGLLDDDNKTTALANDWRLDEKYKAVCDIILGNVYPVELLDLFPNDSIDIRSAISWFMSQGVGSSAAAKMVSLFVLLRSGKIRDKESRPSSTPLNMKQKSKPRVSTKEKQSHDTVQQEQLTQGDKVFVDQPNLHIDLQIHISAESTPEQIETIFRCMAKHLYRDNKS